LPAGFIRFNIRPSSLYSRYTRYLPTSSLRGSTARGSCGIHNALLPERSRGFSSVAQFVGRGSSDTDRSLLPGEGHGRHAVRSLDSFQPDAPPSVRAARRLHHFFDSTSCNIVLSSVRSATNMRLLQNPNDLLHRKAFHLHPKSPFSCRSRPNRSLPIAPVIWVTEVRTKAMDLHD
jgi:hypothetical protein